MPTPTSCQQGILYFTFIVCFIFLGFCLFFDKQELIFSLHLHRIIICWCAVSNAMDVNVQVHTTSNILMSIQIVSTWIDVIRFATATLTI